MNYSRVHETQHLGFCFLLIAGMMCLLASCKSEGKGNTGQPFSQLDINGNYYIYRTYAGQPERGPDLAQIGNALVGGYGAGMHLVCSSYVLPNGWVDIAGELRGNILSMSVINTNISWTGTVNGDMISGTFNDTYGSGTWRAEKTQSLQCNTYEVYGGNTPLTCGGTDGYDPSQYGYTFLGTAVSSATFTASYKYYTIVTRDFNVIHLDTVQGSNGAYFGTNSTGNTLNYLNIGGSPDGSYATVGQDRMSGGGYVDVDASSVSLTSIVVHVVP